MRSRGELKQLWGEKAQKIFSREWNFMGRKITEETQKFGDMHLGLLSDRCAPLALSPVPLIFSYKSEKSLCGTG